MNILCILPKKGFLVTVKTTPSLIKDCDIKLFLLNNYTPFLNKKISCSKLIGS
jgi:hypothetical protein